MRCDYAFDLLSLRFGDGRSRAARGAREDYPAPLTEKVHMSDAPRSKKTPASGRRSAPRREASPEAPSPTAAAPLAAQAVRTVVPHERFSLNLTRENAEVLRTYAEQRGTSVTEAMRRMITLANEIDKLVASGQTLQAIATDGAVTRLIVT